MIDVAESLLREYAICDHCLGRQFAMLGHGVSNQERGRAIKFLLVMEGSRRIREGNDSGMDVISYVAANGFSKFAFTTLNSLGLTAKEIKDTCHLCRGIFNSIEEKAKEVIKKLAKYEFDTFLVGIKGSDKFEEKEDELRVKFNILWGESLRNELSREIGKRIMEITGKNVSYERPHIQIMIDPFKNSAQLVANPFFIYGRYRKLVRGIPQSRWVCSQCKGRGCSECNWDGKMYPDSVEELISNSLLRITESGKIILHAAGREDIDARVLGAGRPFVVEVKNPKVWKINLARLEEEINKSSKGKIEVKALKFSSKEVVRKLKAAGQAIKVYRAVVEFEEDVSDNLIIMAQEALNGKLVNQMTPSRVVHRRSHRLRKKRVYEVELKRLKSNLIEMLIRCQGGLYVKELISGDEGRTKPSLAEITGIQAKCMEVDVMDVEIRDL